MPAAFNIARAVIYGVVLLWTVICLAISVHLHGLLATSDLTRFVPFAIFVCCASLIVMLTLLGLPLLQDRNPVSTRMELGALGLVGIFWLSLGAFLATSDSDDADVECYASEDSFDVIDVPGFSTDTYHAQYRVLEAFSIFNIILIWGFLLFLLFLAVRQHLMNHRSHWYGPVTSCSWFSSGKGSPTHSKSSLPEPVTSRSRSRRRYDPEEERGRQAKRTQNRYSIWKRQSPKPPARAHLATDKYDKFKRGASPRR